MIIIIMLKQIQLNTTHTHTRTQIHSIFTSIINILIRKYFVYFIIHSFIYLFIFIPQNQKKKE